MPYDEVDYRRLQDLDEIIEEELGEKKEIRREEKKEIRREENYKKKSRDDNISMIVCLSLAVLILGISFGLSN